MNIIDEFHKKFYNEGDEIYGKVTYMGFPILKCPLDLWIYQEIIWEYMPRYIIETGTFYGGSALFLAHTVKNAGLDCDIFSIDINGQLCPKADRLYYITDDSVNLDLISDFRNMIGDKKVLVILDSLHTKEHVLKELSLYSEFIKPRGYIIVEDTNLNGHPVRKDWGDGPMEAVKEFLETHVEFKIDETKEKFLMTFNPNGYLKRVT